MANETAVQEWILCGNDYIKSLIEDINKAKTSIDLEVYIFSDDKCAEQVAKALIAAVNRGVKVRILLDGVGTPTASVWIQEMEAAGVEIRVFHPYPWKRWQLVRSLPHVSFFNKILHFFSRLNKRNHRKTSVIDNEIVYVGSANISSCHLNKENGGNEWFDAVIRITGVDTHDLNVGFSTAWLGLTIYDRIERRFHKLNRDPIFRLNYTRHMRRVLNRNFLLRIAKAQKKVWLINPYFNPNFFLLRQLKRAARRNIDVKIILPHISDVPAMRWVAATYYYDLIKVGVKIYEYLPNILHAKIAIVDDWHAIGSSNLNYRSIIHDLEIDVNVRTKHGTQAIEKIFSYVLANSKQISLNDLKKQNFLKKFIGRFLLVFKYFI